MNQKFLSDHSPFMVGRTLSWNVLTQCLTKTNPPYTNNAFHVTESISDYKERLCRVMGCLSDLCDKHKIDCILLQEAPTNPCFIIEPLIQMFSDKGQLWRFDILPAAKPIAILSSVEFSVEYQNIEDRQVLYQFSDGRLIGHVHCSNGSFSENTIRFATLWQSWIDRGALIVGDFNDSVHRMPIRSWKWSCRSMFGETEGVLAKTPVDTNVFHIDIGD